MKIVFLGLASTFTENMNYQDNALCRVTVADGHQVTYISNAEKFVDGVIVPTGFEDKILSDGMRLIRLPYVNMGHPVLTQKLRVFRGVYDILEQVQPDVIFCHNTQYRPILDVVRYKKKHPQVKFYADTHTAQYNSATNWVSLNLLHKCYYRALLKKALPYLDKYFYVGQSERKFAMQHYGVPESLTEFYPLGGFLLPQQEYNDKRLRRREELNIGQGQYLFLHSGKLDARKRTEELLRAFAAVPEINAKLAIIGSIPEERKEVLLPLIEADRRVVYLGWKKASELQEYLCASDLYCQPGSVSATLQNAVCCGCPVMTYPHEPYTADLDFGNLMWVKTQEDMEAGFRAIARGEAALDAMRIGSEKCAKEILDYNALAARLYR